MTYWEVFYAVHEFVYRPGNPDDCRFSSVCTEQDLWRRFKRSAEIRQQPEQYELSKPVDRLEWESGGIYPICPIDGYELQPANFQSRTISPRS